jgi:hypothetical protein
VQAPALETVPVPQGEPQRYDALENASLYTAPAAAPAPQVADSGGKPFWNIWSRN